ncbi:hypothetical protein ACW16K_004539, partial [Escherichia coli]
MGQMNPDGRIRPCELLYVSQFEKLAGKGIWENRKICGQYRLIGINGQISVFDQGMTGVVGCSKFVSIIGQVVVFVLVADPQSAWPFRFFRRSGIQFLNAFAAPRGYAFKPVSIVAVAVALIQILVFLADYCYRLLDFF